MAHHDLQNSLSLEVEGVELEEVERSMKGWCQRDDDWGQREGGEEVAACGRGVG